MLANKLSNSQPIPTLSLGIHLKSRDNTIDILATHATPRATTADEGGYEGEYGLSSIPLRYSGGSYPGKTTVDAKLPRRQNASA